MSEFNIMDQYKCSDEPYDGPDKEDYEDALFGFALDDSDDLRIFHRELVTVYKKGLRLDTYDSWIRWEQVLDHDMTLNEWKKFVKKHPDNPRIYLMECSEEKYKEFEADYQKIRTPELSKDK